MRGYYLLIACFICYASVAFSQQKDLVKSGYVKGIVRDSTLNYGLPAATLAIYKSSDSSLLSYQLSNNTGNFHFNNIPLNIPLKIVATYIGYRKLSRRFKIHEKSNGIDLENINLDRSESTLEDIEIKSAAPVRMNGDTLEFNADAFKMDPNAVTEDLLKKLPGVVVWGDGTITVNGKEISSLLVNGKPFFGGDTKVSTQNIAKDAIDKVQVYRKNIDVSNPLDTISEINLKLKRDKSFGYFGKFAVGYGSTKRFEIDGSLNIFSPNTQIGIVGARNNTNKIANDISTLLRNNTFKGAGSSLEYQPNFRMSGIAQSNIGGITFQRDFIPEPSNEKNNRLTANYFVNQTDNVIDNSTQSHTALGENVTQSSKSSSNSNRYSLAQDVMAKYEKKLNNLSYNISGGLKWNQDNSDKNQKDTVVNSSVGLQSSRDLASEIYTNSKNFNLHASLNHSKSPERSNNRPGNWYIDYLLNIGNDKQTQSNEINFLSLVNPLDDKYFNRRNEKIVQYQSHVLISRLGDFYGLLFGPTGKSHSSFGIDLENSISFNATNTNSMVYDRLRNVDINVINPDLSNIQQTRTFNEQPSLKISKSFISILANRYQKSAQITANLRTQLYSLENKSDHAFQRFSRNYQKITPEVNFNYSNNQFGEFSESIDFTYNSTYKYPTTEQLYPIVDYSSIYNIQLGNPQLVPSNTHELSMNFSHNSLRTKNTFNYMIKLNTGFIRNNFSYSLKTDENGASSYYILNLNGHKYLSLSGSLNKASKFKSNQLQLSLTVGADIIRTPGYIQNFDQPAPQLNYFNNFNTNNSLQLFYSYKDVLSMNIRHEFNTYRTKQTGLGQNTFTSTLNTSSFATNASLTKRWSIGSNVAYNISTFTAAANNKFTIWNANTAYRFMKGNNLEAKFSALDLLKQNKSIVNYGINNMVRQSRSNVLQQYFMLTFSYFPRQFGKKNQKKSED